MTLPCWKWNRIEFPQFLIFYRLKVNSRYFHFRTINSYIMFFSGKGLINPAVIICREISEHVVHCEQRSRDGDGRKIVNAKKQGFWPVSDSEGLQNRIKGNIPIRRLVAEDTGHNYRLRVTPAATRTDNTDNPKHNYP